MIDLLNLDSAEDIYALMAGVDEAVHGGSEEAIAERQLEILKAYRRDVEQWLNGKRDAQDFRAGAAYYGELSRLCRMLDQSTGELRWNTHAKRLAYHAYLLSGELEDLQLVCRIMYQRLDYLWHAKREAQGKLVCNQLLRYIRDYDRSRGLWEEEDVLAELAKAYEVNAKWYGYFGGGDAWYEVCCIRATRIRLYLAELEGRQLREHQRDAHLDAATHFLNRKQTGDPKQARIHVNRALAMMRGNPRLDGNRYAKAMAWEKLAESWRLEEFCANAAGLEMSQTQRMQCRLRSKESRVRALDAWKNLLQWQQCLGVDTQDTWQHMKGCYEALAADCRHLPGEKNARKADKYLRLADAIEI